MMQYALTSAPSTHNTVTHTDSSANTLTDRVFSVWFDKKA